MKIINCIALILISLYGYTKDVPVVKSIRAIKTEVIIKIDGELSEEVWNRAEKAKDFFQNFPYDTSLAFSKTEAMVLFDDDYLYIGAKCYDTISNCDFVITSLKRDWSYPVSDAFVVTIDPFNDKTNGFSFGVNPAGVQREGLVAFGGGQGVSTDWDNKWFSEVKCSKGFWSIEMAIPFKTLRFKPGIGEWGINFSRNDLKRNENSCWSQVPRQFNISTLGYAGKLIWDTPPQKVGTNISIIPYITSGASADYTKSQNVSAVYNAGLDAKVAVSSSLNLDLTVNPDFSQVEVDRQQTNLTRFSLFFPERRNFFIENSDLFARYGFSTIRPFFSRRIGLESGRVIPIIGGARLSGKINQNWRIGIMNIQTKAYNDQSFSMDAQNYAVLALQRQVNIKSNIAIIAVNRQALVQNKFSPNNYNRVLGIDYNHISANNKLMGKIFYHHAFNPKFSREAYAHAIWADYNERNFQLQYNHEIVGTDYIADVGFVPRLYNFDPLTNRTVTIGFIRMEHLANYKFFPKNSIINNHGPGIFFNQYSKLNLDVNDKLLNPSYQFTFQNQSLLRTNFNMLFTKLYFNTDITQSGSKTLLAAGSYFYNNASVEYISSPIKKLNGSMAVTYGEFYNGNITSLNTTLNYRLQPFGNFSFNHSYNLIKMPNGYNSAVLNLIGARIELTFTRSLFLTTFFQYNTQINNININTRLQWRFKPMSDLYLVYSDNYDPINFKVKNRALVLKFVYWFSL